MIRVSRVKLGYAPKQEALLLVALDLLRQLYNAALQQRVEGWQRQRVSLSYYDQCKELTALRADDERYRQLPAQMTRATVLRRLDLAFKAFFRRVGRGEVPGFPRFQGYGRFDTLLFTKQDWRIEGKHLVLKVGPEPIRLRMKNAIHRQGEIRGLRIVRRGERWWADFIVDVGEAPATKPAKRGVGIDVGLRTFATLSDGTQVEPPRFAKKSADRLRAAQQRVSRCERGSKRRAKAKRELVRIYEKVANRRRNFVFQTVAALVAVYDGFAVEKLDIQQMVSTERDAPDGMTKVQARGMRRGIMDSAWSMFTQQLASKAEEAGMPFVAVDPKGTSQRCSGCGSVVRKTLRDRVHDCAACGLVLDRDVNAARNIFDLGGGSAPVFGSGAEGQLS